MMDNGDVNSLHEAVRLGDITMVHTILERDPFCVNDWNRDLKTPLHVVYDLVPHDNLVQDDDKLLVMRVLLDYGADVNAREGHMHETALHFAVNKQQINGVKFLLKNKANLDIRNTFNDTALHYAVKERSGSIMRLLLSYNANPNLNNIHGQTPLDYVVYNCDISSLRILVEHGVKSSSIYKMICKVCLSPYIPSNKLFIEYLIKNGPALDSYGNFSFITLFRSLILNFFNHIGIEHCLFYDLLYRKSIKFDSIMNHSDLHLAAYDLDVKLVKDLLKKRINVNIKNNFDETPLHVVLRKNVFNYKQEYRKITLLLIEHGSNLHAQDYLHKTPLSLAVRKQNREVVNFMLAKIAGVTPTILNNSISYFDAFWTTDFKKNPKLYELFVASTSGCMEIVDRLLDISFIDEASKNCCDGINKIFGNAIIKKQYSLIKILLEAGFRVDGHSDADISILQIDECKEGDLRIACLCWEFKHNAIINQLMRCTFSYVVSNGSINEFVYLLVFMYAISLRSDNLSKDLIPSKGLFKWHNDLSKVMSECNKMLEEMKKDEANNMSIFDVITMPFNLLVTRLKSKENLKACKNLYSTLEKKELLYYEYVVMCRIYLAIEKRNLLNSAKDSMNELFLGVLEPLDFHSLPDKMVWNILAHLDMRELRRLVKCKKIKSLRQRFKSFFFGDCE